MAIKINNMKIYEVKVFTGITYDDDPVYGRLDHETWETVIITASSKAAVIRALEKRGNRFKKNIKLLGAA